MFVLGTGSAPGVIEFEALITVARSAVGTTFSGLQGLWRFTELTYDSHAAQTHCVPVPEDRENRIEDFVCNCCYPFNNNY